MSDIDDLMKLYKEIQENYIKALERENEELRQQREKDSLRIEELEKKLIEESSKRQYIPSTNPNTIPYDKVIGPGNGLGGWGYPNTYPGIGINDNTGKWTAQPIVISSGSTSNETYTAAAGSLNKLEEAKKAYDKLKETMNTVKAVEHRNDAMKDYLQKLQECVKIKLEGKNGD